MLFYFYSSEDVPSTRQLELNLFILFGCSWDHRKSDNSVDSYASIEFDPSVQQPNPENPLGNPPFPGNSRDRLPNWVLLAFTWVVDGVVGGMVDDRVQQISYLGT